MIHTTQDFFVKISKDIREKYFPKHDHSTTKDRNYWDATYAIECFNNGVLTYRQLIQRLAKACNSTNYNINQIVEKHIVSFGEYRYKPKKP